MYSTTSPPTLLLLLLQVVEVVVADVPATGPSAPVSNVDDGEGVVWQSDDVGVVSPDRDGHVGEGVGPSDSLGHAVVYPAVGPPLPQAAVVGHPRDEEMVVEAVRDDVTAPGGEDGMLAVPLRKGYWSLLQQRTSRTRPGRTAVAGAGQTPPGQGAGEVRLAGEGGGHQEAGERQETCS